MDRPILCDLDDSAILCGMCDVPLTSGNVGSLVTHDDPDDCDLGCVVDGYCAGCDPR